MSRCGTGNSDSGKTGNQVRRIQEVTHPTSWGTVINSLQPVKVSAEQPLGKNKARSLSTENATEVGGGDINGNFVFSIVSRLSRVNGRRRKMGAKPAGDPHPTGIHSHHYACNPSNSQIRRPGWQMQLKGDLDTPDYYNASA